MRLHLHKCFVKLSDFEYLIESIDLAALTAVFSDNLSIVGLQ